MLNKLLIPKKQSGNPKSRQRLKHFTEQKDLLREDISQLYLRVLVTCKSEHGTFLVWTPSTCLPSLLVVGWG